MTTTNDVLSIGALLATRHASIFRFVPFTALGFGCLAVYCAIA